MTATRTAGDLFCGFGGTYTYDGNSNRLTRTVNGVAETYAYDSGDKLQSVSVGGTAIKTYGYDAAGRTTSVTSSAGTTTLTYDFESRVTQISGPGINATYSYNGLDTRVGKTENSVSNTFRRSGAYVTDPVLGDGSASYTPGVSRRQGTSISYQHGGLKNLDAQTSVSQNVTAARVYDAFGNVLTSTGTWAGPFGYAGGFGYQADASGLKLLGHRYYDPSTGRFLTRDPIKDGRNWYAYGAGEAGPNHIVDPTGLEWHDPVQIVVDEGFDGFIIAYGDFEWMPGDGWRDVQVQPGQSTHPDMDVDLIVIMHRDGRMEYVFISGGRKGGRKRQQYYVCRDGNVSAGNGTSIVLNAPAIDVTEIIPFVWIWDEWMKEAARTGFPKGYEPSSRHNPRRG